MSAPIAGGSTSEKSSDVDWIELACNCKGLIDVATLSEIYTKTGLKVYKFPFFKN
jgi:hypothetical protein